jgi:7,8-dihydropterin-6-yl-methyl-4-(beta-D-ribofuranosyl)aminobenzene 5'-phosphate synthase
MIIKTLVENISDNPNLGVEHGLSLYIETMRHKILFDTGASQLFAENARKMGVDLATVDIAILSHGHYDHGGGLKTFLALNHTAKIYMNKNAFQNHYSQSIFSQQKYIGLDQGLLPNPRFVFVEDGLIIDEELELFSHIAGNRFPPSGNQDLYMEHNGELLQDDFSHEQNLIISENGKILLVAGCAHKGIVNIVNQFYQDKKRMPDVVIGGFHLYNGAAKRDEAPSIVTGIGQALMATKVQYFTGHCTGKKSYEQLKGILGDKLGYISTGSQINL